ncbi:Twin-arginine translocation pathway signal sequence domain protein precursor [Nonlabens sp. YIK11]|uniref:DUF1501 domain-containing protein n=1 Tax=Nonlabens sp. YIK11 TaxID=1453349 RepID=UPI0006DD2CC9|nr:DUF1501 domain-containing protein [Nonlabens sp. YIK11]KQC32584.1 Twin-arginine translocation pathway signal sequence domain protein precursor [Nonlabens sp. YIK11]
MNRRNFMTLTATASSGAMMLPNFLKAAAHKYASMGEQSLVFLQLDGGNDGLNTYVPFEDPLYQEYRPTIKLSADDVINKNKGMGFHPALKGLAAIQQAGDLTVLQNVGYPEPVKSHFRSQEIWQTGSKSSEYLRNGWLGRYLDVQCDDIIPTAGMNVDRIDNLALKGSEPNSITVRDVNRFKTNLQTEMDLSGHPSLDFVRTIAAGTQDGSKEIQKALKKAGQEYGYPKSALAVQLKWIAQLIKGELNSKVYYTSLGGFDTHNNQLGTHARKLTEVNDAVFSFYKDLKSAGLMDRITLVIFSEFGRRVKDNGSGTDHGTAAPVFIVGGNNRGRVLGKNPNLANLSDGDLIHDIDFRSVYASLLKNKLDFDPSLIGINNSAYAGIF